jgi:hypothetical protein
MFVAISEGPGFSGEITVGASSRSRFNDQDAVFSAKQRFVKEVYQ